MDALPLRVTIKNTFLEADFGIPTWRRCLSDPVKIRLRDNTTQESDEDGDTAATGTTTPDSNRSSTATSALASPAFVQQVPWSKRSCARNAFSAHLEPRNGGKTLSVRNVPAWYKQDMLLEEILDSGFFIQRDFDFCYLPLDAKTGLNFGYCFLNFVKDAAANAFEAAFHGRTPRLGPSEPAFEVFLTTVQDLAKIHAYQAMQDSPARVAPPEVRLRPSRQALFCPQCGCRIDANKFNFCSQCGTPLLSLRQSLHSR